MTAEEQTELNTALIAAGRDEGVVIRDEDGAAAYFLCELHPVRKLTEAELIEFAALFSVTIAPA